VLEDLDEELLYRILVEPANSISSQYQSIFDLEGISLNFDDKYFRVLANDGFQKKTGARGLRTVIERDLKTVQYELPDLAKKQGVIAVNVDAHGNIDYVKQDVKKTITDKK
jgi:ATP-dependent Clp protease ATP-binding subunit ClpX